MIRLVLYAADGCKPVHHLGHLMDTAPMISIATANFVVPRWMRRDSVDLLISHTTETDRWIAQHHYLHSTPAGAVVRMEFYESDILVGAMMWGRSVSTKFDRQHILEYT